MNAVAVVAAATADEAAPRAAEAATAAHAETKHHAISQQQGHSLTLLFFFVTIVHGLLHQLPRPLADPSEAAVATKYCGAYPLHMPFQITSTREFAAAHQIRLYDGSLEPLHGHNWRVTVTVAADGLDAIGVVMDFHELDRQLEAIIRPMHNAHLNEQPAFAQRNPTTEHVALHVADSLELSERVRLVSVEVWETSGNSAVYRP